jgi:hypothetical protein
MQSNDILQLTWSGFQQRHAWGNVQPRSDNPQLLSELPSRFALQEENRTLLTQVSSLEATVAKATSLAVTLEIRNAELESDLRTTSEQLQAMHLAHLVRPNQSMQPLLKVSEPQPTSSS